VETLVERDGKPRVVKEIRRKRLSVKPPAGELHSWTDSMADFRGPGCYVWKDAIDKIISHCRSMAVDKLEALGFLAGDVFSWKGHEYTVVRDAITTELDSTSSSVRFDREGFPAIFEKLDRLEYSYIIVGWYHSHPGYGCFMSATDVETHRGSYNEPYHLALVVDPVREELACFAIEAGECNQIRVMVYESMEWPMMKKTENNGKS
jgi:proteasome lid subunit RPN8/RPN11